MILWITGNSGSGKTTLAKEIQSTYNNWIILDGDEVRQSVSKGLNLSQSDRIENNLRTYKLAQTLEKQGFNVVVASIAPYQKARDMIDVKWVYLPGGKSGKEYPYEVPNIKPYEDLDSLNLFN